jgi:Tol biopolymer transport system component
MLTRTALGAVLVSVALLGLGLATVAFPATSATAGKIAYSDVDGDLYVASAQGTGTTTVYESDSDTGMEALAISPDGKQVLAVEYGDESQLVLLPVGGGSPTTISGTDGADSGSFSPDGTQVVFSLADGASSLAAGIYTVSVSGGTPKRLVTTPANDTDSIPQYSPDGTKIAFARDAFDNNGDETDTLELMPAGGGTPKPLATDVLASYVEGGRISFSPDGTKLVYAGDDNSGIFIVPASGGNATQLTSDEDYWPSFSSDGSKVIFSRDATSDDADDNADSPVFSNDNDIEELWTVDASGTGAAVVAEGDFEDLSVATTGSASAPTSSSGSTASSSTTSTSKTTTSASSTTAAPASNAKATSAFASAISVTTKKPHYVVAWKGTAPEWKVTLEIGHTSIWTTVKGAVHSHVFTLPGAKGSLTVLVKAL